MKVMTRRNTAGRKMRLNPTVTFPNLPTKSIRSFQLFAENSLLRVALQPVNCRMTPIPLISEAAVMSFPWCHNRASRQVLPPRETVLFVLLLLVDALPAQ